MTFEVLTPYAAVDLSSPEFDGLFDRAPNVDATGGTLTVNAAASAYVYTAADGTQTQSAFVAPEGYEVIGADVNAVVFGDALDGFVVGIQSLASNNAVDGVHTYGLIEVGLNDEGVPVPTSFNYGAGPAVLRDDPNFGGDANLEAYFVIYPMGDGRVGFEVGDNDFQSINRDYGYFNQAADGIDVVVLESSDSFDSTYSFQAADDGNIFAYVDIWYGIDFVRGPGIQYLDAMGESLGLGISRPDIEGTFDENLRFRSAVIDDEGNLAVWIRDIQEGDDYVATFAFPDPEEVTEDDTPTDDDGDIVEDDETEDDTPAEEEVPVVVPVPTEMDDTLTLTAGNDVIDALGGNDTVFAGDGADWVIGGAGNDSIDGGAGSDAAILGAADDDASAQGGLFGGEGDDSINGRAGDDLISGGDGNDDLRGSTGDEGGIAPSDTPTTGMYGGDGDDFVRGNAGDDLMYGGAGADDMNGGKDNDAVYSGTGDDRVAGFDGNDSLYGGDGNDYLHGGRGNDFIEAGDGDDIIRGAQGDDEIYAYGGANTVYGGQGEDMIEATAGSVVFGGEGADVFMLDGAGVTVTGGEGADTYYYPVPNLNLGDGADTITDFEIGSDEIEVGDEELTFDDIFLSQEDSTAVIAFGEVRIRLENTNVEDISETDFFFESDIALG